VTWSLRSEDKLVFTVEVRKNSPGGGNKLFKDLKMGQNMAWSMRWGQVWAEGHSAWLDHRE
jgi:hypothetical protein